jgi:hypothetical protein
MSGNKAATIFFAFLILALGLVAYVPAQMAQTPTPKPFDVNSIDFSKISDDDIEKTEAHRNELRKELDKNLDQVGQVAADQGSTLSDVAAATLAAKKAFAAYKKVTEEQITKGNLAIAALNHVLKKLHLAKALATGFWALLVALVVMHLPLLLKPYSLYIGAGLLVVGSAAIWFFL